MHMKAMFSAILPRRPARPMPVDATGATLTAKPAEWRAQHRWAISCGIDHLREYRDIYGEEAANMLFDGLFDIFAGSCRSNDRVFRRDGEGYVLVVSGETLDRVKRCAERHRRAVEDLQAVHQGSPFGIVTVSMGIAAVTSHGPRGDEGFDEADAALHRAQRAGYNQVTTAIGLVLS